jgi:hypothetical protein
VKLSRALLFIALWLLPSLAVAQSAIQAAGSRFTPGHTVRTMNPQGTALGDAGGAAGSSQPGQGYLTELGITNTGLPLCVNDALTNAAGGYHQLCLGANALGGAQLSLNAFGGASAIALNFNINGATYGFPGNGQGNILGPNASTVNSLARWNATNGQLLADTGTMPANTTIGAGFVGPTSWNTGATIYDGLRISVNNYPVTSEFGNNLINLTQGLVGAVNVPSNATNPQGAASFGIAGYGVSASSAVGAAGTFGFGGILNPNVPSWGGNFLVANCPSPNCTTSTGYSGGTQWGIEVDANIMKSGGAAPAGTKVFGVNVIGASETQVGAGGESYGMVVQALGIGATPPIPWQIAYSSADAAAIIGVSIGGTTLPGTTGPSQTLCFNAWNVSTPIGACINETAGGVLQINNNGGFVTLSAGGVLGLEVSSSTVNVLAPSTAPSTSSEPLDFQGINNASAMIVGTIQLVASGANGIMNMNSPGGGYALQNSNTPLFSLTPAPTAGQTAIGALVFNNAGVNFVNFAVGAVDSCGTGHRCITVPN